MLRKRIERLQKLAARCRTYDVESTEVRPLQTVQDVIDVLEEQVAAVRKAEGVSTLDKARAIGNLVGLARKAIETGTLAGRIEMLETVLHQRATTDQP